MSQAPCPIPAQSSHPQSAGSPEPFHAPPHVLRDSKQTLFQPIQQEPEQLPTRVSARAQLLHPQRHGLTQLQSAAGSVGEEESGLRNKATHSEKTSSTSLELSSFSRLVSRLSCSLSLLTRKISLSSGLVRCSIACTGRQLSHCFGEAFGYDNNQRQ